jgi:polyisoprenoid-binding protein YceI
MKSFLLFLSVVSTILAVEVDVKWTAFKTPAKVGVSGDFRAVSVHGDKLENLNLSIKTSSINSNNLGRDITLVEFFWKVQGVSKIEAKVLEVYKKYMKLEISMNGISKEMLVKTSKVGDTLSGNGKIDLSDFNMLPSLKSINSACYYLHAGKTWQDVNIGFEIRGL